ncbi:hypothetical protein KKH13_04965 [Patescibacteria group bacterium]|nr:hypothetical protein [Patescibacteria group bacterium]
MLMEQHLATREPTTALALEKAALERSAADIALLEEYTANNLVQDVDFGSVPGIALPFLHEPGASKITNAFKTYPRHKILFQVIDAENGLITFIIEAELVSRETESVMATGVGACSTLEGKYGSRWVGSRDLEEMGLAEEGLRTRTRDARGGGSYTQYKVPNPDWGDLINTILSMAAKRAEADAAKALPGVSTALGILFAGHNGPDWRKFWSDMRAAGISPDQVHKGLGVVSLRDYRGSLSGATFTLLQKYGKKPPAPTPQATATLPNEEPPDELLLPEGTKVEVKVNLPPRDPQTLKNLGEFFTATNADFHLNKTQTLEKLGFKNDASIGDLAESYMKVWVAMGGGV